MNILVRSLFITCLWSITAHTTQITILEKQAEIGKDPKTQKTLLIRTYAFVKDTDKETAATRWIGVFPYENELMFFSIENGYKDLFPVTDIISTQPMFNVSIDPTAQEPIINPQTTKDGNHSSSVTMEIRLAHQVQIFKDLVILTAKGNTKALSDYVNKITLEKTNDIIEKVIDCQGACYIECDDIEKFESIMQTKQMPAAPILLTGSLTFVPMQAILEQALAAEAAKNKQNTSKA